MTFLATNGVQSYASAVREALGDLPPEQAHAVLDGLDDHLAEIVAEGTVDLEPVLGSPESYAAELRASAGLPASTRRTSWAAPSAELRSDAPTAEVASEPGESLEPGGVGRLAAAFGRKFSTRRMTLSRAFLVAVYGLLLVYLIRSARPVNVIQVVFGTLLIAGIWRLLRAASSRAEIPAHWVAHAPRVLGGTAVVLALILGSRIGSSGTQYVYVNNSPTSTAFARFPPREGGQIAVPNMIGTTLAETRDTLSRFNLIAVVEGGETDLSQRLLTVRMDPAPGALLDPGSVVKVVVASISSLIPTTVVSSTPTTGIVPSVSTPSVTTVTPAVPEAATSVPVVTTMGTTTVAVATSVDPAAAPATTIKK
jgi:hypothetical protein